MKTYCLLNHNLTENQIKELAEKYNSSQILYPSAELSQIWAQIPTDSKIDHSIIKNIQLWLKDFEKGDQLIVQGESGHTFTLVDWALNQGIIALHAVSKRIETETKEGELVTKKHVFCHQCFREYERCRN